MFPQLELHVSFFHCILSATQRQVYISSNQVHTCLQPIKFFIETVNSARSVFIKFFFISQSKHYGLKQNYREENFPLASRIIHKSRMNVTLMENWPLRGVILIKCLIMQVFLQEPSTIVIKSETLVPEPMDFPGINCSFRGQHNQFFYSLGNELLHPNKVIHLPHFSCVHNKRSEKKIGIFFLFFSEFFSG